MAPTASSPNSTQRKPRSTTRRTTSGARTTGARKTTARRSTAKAAHTRASTQRTAAARATARETRTGAQLIGSYAERAVLVPVGAALVARDRVTELLDNYSTPKKAEAQLKRFERRGVTARNRFERQVRKTRTRLERQLRSQRRSAEKALGRFDRRRTTVVKNVRDQVESAASQAQDRVTSLA
jgi:hypothetical protein